MSCRTRHTRSLSAFEGAIEPVGLNERVVGILMPDGVDGSLPSLYSKERVGISSAWRSDILTGLVAKGREAAKRRINIYWRGDAGLRFTELQSPAGGTDDGGV